MKKALILVVSLVILLRAGLVLAGIAFENTKVTTHTFPGPIDELVVLTLEVRCRASFVTCFSELRMSVPAGTKITLDTDAGDVEARGIDVHGARVRSDAGDMRLELVGRQRLVRAHADSGDMNVDGISRNERAPRSIEARTDSGDVTLNGR